MPDWPLDDDSAPGDPPAPPPNDATEAASPRGGPQTPEGKERSSLNALKHGCCATRRFLPGENPDDYQALYLAWLDEFRPQVFSARRLLTALTDADWALMRALARFQVIDAALEQKDPLHWTPDDHTRMSQFLRYKTAAERSFHRAFQVLEQRRKEQASLAFRTQVHNDRLQLERERIQARFVLAARQEQSPAGQPDKTPPEPSPEQKRKQAEKERKEAEKRINTRWTRAEQWIQIWKDEADGITKVQYFPPNAEILEKVRQQGAPDIVYRRMHFIGPVPPEFRWMNVDDDFRQTGGLVAQRIWYPVWLECIARDDQTENKFPGRTYQRNLPRWEQWRDEQLEKLRNAC